MLNKKVNVHSPLWNLLVLFSVFTQAACLVLIWLSSAPLLEGYGIAVVQKYGSYSNYFPGIAARPLSLVPQYLASTVSGLDSLGYSLIGVFLAVIRLYFLARIFGNNLGYWVLAPIVLIAPPWFAIGNERFSPAVGSFTLALASWYFFLNRPTRRFLYVLLAFLSSLTYPPILLASLSAYSSWKIYTGIRNLKINFAMKDVITLSIPLLLYFIYLKIQNGFYPGAYDSQLSSGFSLIKLANLFHSYLVKYTWQSLILFAIVLFFIYKNPERIVRLLYKALAITFLLFSSSVVYVQQFTHTNDPERIFFPSSIALLLFGIAVMKGRDSGFKSVNLPNFLVLVSALVMIIGQFHYWPALAVQNRAFLVQVKENVESHPLIESLQVRDHTGRYGDVNTFYGDSLVSALRYSYPSISKAEICTVRNTIRFHPIADRYPIATTKECAEIDESFDLYVEILDYDPLRLKLLSKEDK